MSLLDVVFAQEEELTQESEIGYVFGQELRFSLRVQDASSVERITLTFRPELSAEEYVVNVPFDSGETISVTHPIDLSLVKVRPYSQIYYSWEVKTASGAYDLPEQSFAYEDDRFAWKSTTREAITAHWTDGGPSLGQDALDVSAQALALLSKVLPIETIVPFDVYVYPSSADMNAGRRLAGFDPEQDPPSDPHVILVTAVNPQSALADLGQSIPYELTHLLLFRVSGDDYLSVPWWLIEGLGLTAQAQPHPDHAQFLEDAVNMGSTIPFQQLCQAPTVKGNDAILASAQSASLVNYILARFGSQRFAELTASYANGVECKLAVQQILGISLQDLEEAWLNSQMQRSILEQIFSDYGLWLLILLISLGFTGFLVWYSVRGTKQR
jgi:hypothetical protein